MIKRVAIFLVLLGGGFLALNLLVEKEGPEAGSSPGGTAPQAPRGPGIKVPAKGHEDSHVVVQPSGEIEIKNTREVQLPQGRIRLVTVYVLHAEDSRPETDNRLHLEGVTIDFYEFDEKNPLVPPVKSSSMTAARARIELSQDEDNLPRIDEDKLMEFWGVVYSAGLAGDGAASKVTLGHAVARNSSDMVHLWTPTETEPVRLETLGENGFVVTGEGLDAWAPSSRNDRGDVKLKTVGIRDVRILHNPLLTRADGSIRSKGELRIKEDSRSGTVLITMTDDVELRARRTSDPPSGDVREFTATGESLRAILSRSRGSKNKMTKSEMENAHWRSIQLHGSPAHLTNGTEIDLTCETLTVLPDPKGNPYWVSASGSGDHTPVVRHTVHAESSAKGGVAATYTNTYRSAGNVHVIQVRRQHSFFLSSFGFAEGIPPDFEQLIIFEKEATLDSPKDDLHIVSKGGLTLLRSDLPALKDRLVLQGRGAVTVKSSYLDATGNQGFVLRQWTLAAKERRTPGVDERDALVRREFQLGPPTADPSHRYTMTRRAIAIAPGKKAERPDRTNPKDRPFRITGSGMCKVRVLGEAIEDVHLSSIAEDIDVRLTDADDRLWQVRTLDAWFAADGTPSSFVAKGKECRLEFESDQGTVKGHAEEIHHPQRDTYRLLGNLAEADHQKFGLMRGRDIFFQQLTEEDGRFRITHRAELHLRELPELRKKGSDLQLTVNLLADEIRGEPFLTPPMFRQLHDSLVPSFARTGLTTRYLTCDGNVRFDYEVTIDGQLRAGAGNGKHLVLRTDPAGELFVAGRMDGEPASLSSVDARGRRAEAESHLIRFFHDISRESEYITLHPVANHRPELRLHEAEGDETGAPLRLVCDGQIELAPDSIFCRGPVELRSLDQRGKVDPDGYKLDCRSAKVGRSDSGDITSVLAKDDVDFRWGDAVGRSDELEIDVAKTLLIVRGIAAPASVAVPSGNFFANQVNYDYRTRMVKVWKPRKGRAPARR